MALSVADRAIGAIIGAAVADAAAQPMHWIYNPERLKEVLSDLEPSPEFRPQSANPFYRRETGEQTCYGDQAYVLLESLSQCGDVDVQDLTRRIYKFFGPGTVYDLPLNDPYRKKGGPKAILPIDGPWRNGSLKAFMRNVDAGEEETGSDVDCQMDGVTKLAPVVAMYAGRPDMLEKVEEAMRVTQNNDMCVAVTLAAARFLEHFILNETEPSGSGQGRHCAYPPGEGQPSQDIPTACTCCVHKHMSFARCVPGSASCSPDSESSSLLCRSLFWGTDRPPGDPRVLEGEDTQISSSVGARRKCGPKKSTDVVQL
ncbi:Crystallin J1A [Scomber scombrus]|uniref:Crystallin J1A n=1 Tax=Scomber scombrus TaxID=13677 RepID=A0AAV1MZY0_SCOSC